MRYLIWIGLLAISSSSGCMGEHVIGDEPQPPRDPSGVPLSPPEFGATVQASVAPPPVSGGTLAVLRGDTLAVASDPDRDRVYVIDLANRKVKADLALRPGDEPGRLVEDGAGRVHVVLRRGGAIVDIDTANGTVIGRRPVCAIARGIDYDEAGDQLWVACMGGELIALPAGGGAATRTLQLDDDLRDVVVDGGLLYVSRFRSAEVLIVDAASGKLSNRFTPSPQANPLVRLGSGFSASVAWRMVRGPNGGTVVVHQAGVINDTMKDGAGYGGFGCDGLVHTEISDVTPGGAVSAHAVQAGLLAPIDIAISPDGKSATVVNAGRSHFRQLPSNQVVTLSLELAPQGGCRADAPTLAVDGEAIAVAWRSSGQLLVQTREPAALQLAPGLVVPLSATSVADTGHAVFHTDSGTGIACISCHPEGGEDGRVWNIQLQGQRRTLSLRGGVMERAPFHWSGDLPDINSLMSIVFQGRMGGPALDGAQVAALSHYLEAIPALPPPAGDGAAIARGKALFESAGKGNCASCHGGAQLTNGAIANVGSAQDPTSQHLKVPSLRGLAWRAPYMHAGCAPTLAARFNEERCGGTSHGGANLTAPEIADLVTYLKSL